MNRAERRRAARKGITAKDLHTIKQEEGLRATRFAVDAYSVAVAMVLYDKLHFDKNKIIKTLKQIEDLFDSVNKDYLTIEDMKTVLSEELGIEFKEGFRG